MRQMRGIDLKRACLVPSSVFSSPHEVADSEVLSLTQKLAILRRWEFDARRIGSLAGKPSMLAKVEDALEELSTEPDSATRQARGDSGRLAELERGAARQELSAEPGPALVAAHGLAGTRS